MSPVFITGVQRSGTTLLSVMLGRHPEILMEDRVISFRLLTVIQNAAEIWPYNLEVDQEVFYHWLIRHDSKGRLAEFLDYEDRPAGETLQQLIHRSIDQRLTDHQKQCWGDKGPNLQYYMPGLLQLFPKARFVHIVRDGRATALSMSRRSYQSLRLSAQEWVDGNVQAMVQREVMGLQRVLIIRFEDLLSEPEETLRKVCNFLSITYSAQMLDLQQDIPEEERYVKSSLQPDKINAFQKELPPHRLRQLERIQGPLLRRLGYQLLSDPPLTDFRPLSLSRQILLRQAGNFHQLFRYRREGMVGRKKVEVTMSFPRRVHHFLMYLSRDLFSKSIHRRLFQSVYYKKKYYRKDHE